MACLSSSRSLYLGIVVSMCLIALHHLASTKLTAPRDLSVESPFDTSARPKATFVIICQEEDLERVLSSVQHVEDRFNKRFRYPWTILNDEPFTDDFKTRVRAMSNARISFGTIPPDQWLQPEWINKTRAEHVRNSMFLSRVPFGGSTRHRNIYRFNSGFLSGYDLLRPYQYYWRIEPGALYFCDLLYDPFSLMQRENMTYGFNFASYEVEQTIPTLWESVYDFTTDIPDLIPEKNLAKFVSDDGGDSYNLCHYEGSFEIVDMEFLRTPNYRQFFDYLDQRGGFYYERWGSAPILSIALSLFLDKSRIHFFNDVGYRHEEMQHCPQGDAHARGRCSCYYAHNFDWEKESCLSRWQALEEA